MRFDIMTLFPDLVNMVLSESIIGRANKNEILTIRTHQIRDYSEDKHRRVDDTPYGGGRGMLMAAPPIKRCWDAITEETKGLKSKTIYMTPQGSILTQKKAEALAKYENIIILCGHYEGVDKRVIDEIIDEEISIGDYVLTGGEIPACVLCDCIGRLVAGVLPSEECHELDSISCGILEYPQYTRPREYNGIAVPDILLSGDHSAIARWRFDEALKATMKKRPDLL